MGKNDTLSRKGLTKKQLQVIVLMLEEHSITAAARKAGIGKSTVYRWLKVPAFKERLESGRRAMFAEAIDALKAAAGKAVDRLVRVVGSKDEGEARRAATTVLELGFRAVEIDEYEGRISALEASVAGSMRRGETDRLTGGFPKAGTHRVRKSGAPWASR